ncbi:hypothetical protein QBC44DRAFT_148990 [Cladorrhinum sp. PSN332]|nr:hypothetical protein QBC44DRAFT_148990 [Cladorrhinum sp. PSN332]
MDVYRPSTRDSQRTFVPSHQPGEFPRDLRLSHTTSRAHSQLSSQYYSDEKSVVESPILGHAALPGLKLNSPIPTSPRQGSYWTERDLDPLPRYPGTPIDVPATLEVPPIEDQSRSNGTICGIRRRLFLWLLGLVAIVLLAIAIGVGVGVGLGHQKQTAEQPIQSSVTSNSSGISTATATSGVILPTATTHTSTAPSATATGSCPGMDNTQYYTSSGKKFLHLCGVDYSGQAEAINVGNATTATFKECVELCSKKTGCTGAGWGIGMDDRLNKPNCWMKSSLNQSHTATPQWNFAVLLAGDNQ